MKKHKVIITGSTGMVGEGILHICLQSDLIERVLVVNRKTLNLQHPKLKEIIHSDFFNLEKIESQLHDYDACFFCLGISSVGVKADDYFKTTYTLSMHFAETISKINTSMKFIYVSGAGTDDSEKGRIEWARVKGKTENDLATLPFEKVYAFRPGFIKPIKGLRYTHSFYKYINWFFPIGRLIYPNGFCTMTELGNSMIYLLYQDYPKRVIDGLDIIKIAKKSLI